MRRLMRESSWVARRSLCAYVQLHALKVSDPGGVGLSRSVEASANSRERLKCLERAWAGIWGETNSATT